SRRRHTRLQGDWSSDVCSSDLHARAVHAEGGEGAEVGLDARPAARVGARDGERDGDGGHAARPAPASGRGGRPYASRTLSPRSGQRAEGGRSSTSSPSSFTYSGAWSGCGKSEAQKKRRSPTSGITPTSERSSGSHEIQHWRRK